MCAVGREGLLSRYGVSFGESGAAYGAGAFETEAAAERDRGVPRANRLGENDTYVAMVDGRRATDCTG